MAKHTPAQHQQSVIDRSTYLRRAEKAQQEIDGLLRSLALRHDVELTNGLVNDILGKAHEYVAERGLDPDQALREAFEDEANLP